MATDNTKVTLLRGWSAAKNPLGVMVITTPTARNTSVCRDAGWMAHITGVDAKFNLAREFSCGRKGGGEFRLLVPGVYEYRNLCGFGQSNYSYKKYGGDDGFLRYDGTVVTRISKTDAEADIAAQMSAARTTVEATAPDSPSL